MIGYAPVWGRGCRMSQNAFNSRSKTINDLLGSSQPSRLVVPPFQRGYSWKQEHVKVFWEDITDQKRKKKYFLGPIVILDKEDGTIELLDGQQRLATATILFSVLRDIARELKFQDASDFAAYIQRDFIIGDEGLRCLELGQTDDSYFRETIQEGKPTARKPTIRSQRYISEARRYLSQAIATVLSSQDQFQALQYLRELRNTLRNDLVMACIDVGSDEDAFQIFETLNDRGLRLSVPDLLLNYLMRGAPGEGERKQIRKIWDDMLTAMGRRDISRFMRHLWVSKYGDLKSEGLFPALKSHITAKSISSLVFVQACANECRNYVALLDSDEEQLKGATPYVRSLLKGIDAQSALPLLLSAFVECDITEFTKITQWLLVFITRWSILVRQDASTLESLLFDLARNVRGLPDEHGNSHKVTASDIKAILKKNAPTKEQIESSVERLVLPNESADYVIRKMSDALGTKTKERVTGRESNLEHIYPQNPEEDGWGGEANQALMEPYTWHIGNLTMLGERLNAKGKNLEFEDKVKKYEASELVMANDIARDYKGWDRSTIEDRAKKLAPLLIKIWNFDNPSTV